MPFLGFLFSATAWQTARTAIARTAFSLTGGKMYSTGSSVAKGAITKVAGFFGAGAVKQTFAQKAFSLVGGAVTAVAGAITGLLTGGIGLLAGGALVLGVGLAIYGLVKVFSSDDRKPDMRATRTNEPQLSAALAPALAPQITMAPAPPQMQNGLPLGIANVSSAYPAAVVDPRAIAAQQTTNNPNWAARFQQRGSASNVQSLTDQRNAVLINNQRLQ